ncbi:MULTISPECIES: hypothetical protein [Actinomycetes]|uniref:hypothetical protein n=1 Tax=Actinomycetes TaxID=1760 RepID=UPI0033EE79BD
MTTAQYNQYLIIDTNIAKSYNDPARNDTSLDCLLLLNALQDAACKVGVVTSPELETEWTEHASRAFNRWWASMESRRRIRHIEDRRVADYRRAISKVEDEGIRTAMEKDAFIVELVILNWFAVASRDDRQRNYVVRLGADYEVLRKIQWFNPSEDWQDWLRGGCVDSTVFQCN